MVNGFHQSVIHHVHVQIVSVIDKLFFNDIKITSIKWVDGPIELISIEVEPDHNYFVGDLLVHNTGPQGSKGQKGVGGQGPQGPTGSTRFVQVVVQVQQGALVQVHKVQVVIQVFSRCSWFKSKRFSRCSRCTRC